MVEPRASAFSPFISVFSSVGPVFAFAVPELLGGAASVSSPLPVGAAGAAGLTGGIGCAALWPGGGFTALPGARVSSEVAGVGGLVAEGVGVARAEAVPDFTLLAGAMVSSTEPLDTGGSAFELFATA